MPVCLSDAFSRSVQIKFPFWQLQTLDCRGEEVQMPEQPLHHNCRCLQVLNLAHNQMMLKTDAGSGRIS